FARSFAIRLSGAEGAERSVPSERSGDEETDVRRDRRRGRSARRLQKLATAVGSVFSLHDGGCGWSECDGDGESAVRDHAVRRGHGGEGGEGANKHVCAPVMP